MNKKIIVFAVILITILLIYIPLLNGNTSREVENIVNKMNYSSIEKIECNNVKLNGSYGHIKKIHDAGSIRQFFDLLKKTNDKKSAIGVSPNKSSQHTNCNLYSRDGEIIVSVSAGNFDDGSNFTSIYKSKFIVYDKKIRNTELADSIVNYSDEFFNN